MSMGALAAVAHCTAMTDRPSEGEAAASPLPDISDIIGTGLDNDAPLPPDPAALDADPAARAAWDSFPPSARKLMLWWVISAARSETQRGRINEIVAKAALGERARR